ncbi:hypothetical protein [Nonomuraea basaltis]|uniref:hypothetical protein n=1 Tax=Nonomuraea basaltis TaxID=2495887 RepID=UPI00110C433A|nr:hypothetical protein [Nonomuraea basaltis]TMR98414.1 hypothetical protein EJK15_12710 [Nonomuraea basaltis]
MLPETVARSRDLVVEMGEDPEVQVAIFISSTPDYFFNHFDLDLNCSAIMKYHESFSCMS